MECINSAAGGIVSRHIDRALISSSYPRSIHVEGNVEVRRKHSIELDLECAVSDLVCAADLDAYLSADPVLDGEVDILGLACDGCE